MHIYVRILFTSPLESHDTCFHPYSTPQHLLSSDRDSCRVRGFPVIPSLCNCLLCHVDSDPVTVSCFSVCHAHLSCPETAASSEQCSSDSAPGVEEIPCQAVTAPAASVASPAADHIQVGSSDALSSERIHSGLPTPPNRRTCLQLNFYVQFICRPAAGPNIDESRLL